MVISLTLSLVLLVHFHAIYCDEYDPPDYNLKQKILMDISEEQTKSYILNAWKLPEVRCGHGYCNPSMVVWIFNDKYTKEAMSLTGNPPFLIVWSNDDTHWGNFYMIAAIGPNNSDTHGNQANNSQFKVLKQPDTLEIFDDHNGTNRRPFNRDHAQDIRVYLPHSPTGHLEEEIKYQSPNSQPNSRTHIRIAYWDWCQLIPGNSCTRDGTNYDPKLAVMEMKYTDLYFHESLDAMYVLPTFKKLDASHEFDHGHQKNWSPFIYQPPSASSIQSPSSTTTATTSLNFFIYSILPHRVVYGNESRVFRSVHADKKVNIDQVAVELVSHTRLRDHQHSNNNHTFTHISKSAGKFHSVGSASKSETATSYPDPSTTANTNTNIEHELWKPYGHTRGGTPALLLDTPYGKRYLTFFHSEAKYMTSWCLTYFFGSYLFEPDPPFKITHFSSVPIIPNPIYNQTNKWAFQNIDYIAFPMGFYYTDEHIYLCMGRNDREGWIVTMNKTNFLLSLSEVTSEVHVNNYMSMFT